MVSAHKRHSRALLLLSRAFYFGATGHIGESKNENDVSLVFSWAKILLLFCDC
jgi:hypothetical protein